jgi:SNF2 family DNA or RNA helicase
MFIDYLDNRLTVVDIGVDTRLLAGIPSKLWSNEKRKWLVPMVKLNEKYLSETSGITISDLAKQMMTKALKKMEAGLRPAASEMPAVQFKLPPMKHQMDALRKLWPVRYGGLFSEPGTGKSKIALDLAAMLLLNKEIDGIIIVCPTSLKKNWEEQLRLHMSAKYFLIDKVKPQAGPNALPLCPSPVPILIVGSEALSTKTKALEQATLFNKKHKAFTIFDESHFFKNHTSMRTKNAKEVCGVRGLIMTGTPISQGIQDLYGQFALMSTSIVGAKDFFCFRNRYCVMGGFKDKQIIGQTNVGELVDILDPFVFQVLKKDCLDLPGKVYQKRLVKLNPKQKAAYSDALENIVNLPEEQIDIENVLVQFLHLQQITGGFLKHKEALLEFGSEKLAVLEQIVEGMPQTGKMVVFARYLHEIEMVVATLKPYGGVSARHGLMSEEDKDQHVKDFRTGPNRFFVTSQMAGGTGLTLVEASTTVFYSNTFSMTERTQSEDRTHRIGTTSSVLYIDIVAENTVDERVIEAIGKKMDFAQYVAGLIKEGSTLKEVAGAR